MPKLRPMKAVLALSVVLPGCAPVFSDLQSARVLAPGQTEVTPSIGTVAMSPVEDDDLPQGWSRYQDQVGVQAGVGTSAGVELRGRAEYVVAPDLTEIGSGVEAFMVALGVKVPVFADRVSVYVPVGLAFGESLETSDTIALMPTLLTTVPLAPGRAELNLSAKLLAFFGNTRPMWAVNAGLALGKNVRRLAVRPEVGFLFDLGSPSTDPLVMHLSLGLSFGRP